MSVYDEQTCVFVVCAVVVCALAAARGPECRGGACSTIEERTKERKACA